MFLCVFWIYHAVDRRARSFGSSGTTSNLTEGTFTVPTKNETSALDLYPTIFDDVVDSPPSRTIAIVLPVTSFSLPRLFESLSGLSTIPHLGEIHLVCPENVTNIVRNELRRTLSRDRGLDFGHTEFFVTFWRREWSEAQSTLRAASNILSDNILVLPQDALGVVDDISRGILLSGPPSLRIPLGLHGSEVSCERKYQNFLAARFVVPPLLLPSRLETKNRSYFHLASWQEVGAHFTQVERVGGIVLPETPENANNCNHSNASETVPLHPEHSNSTSDSSQSNDLLVILVVKRWDVRPLSKLACEFKSRGKEVKVIAYRVLSGPIEPSDFASGGCGVGDLQVFELQDPASDRLLGNPLGVFLTLKEYRFPPEFPLEANSAATVIRIPRMDLPHCGWIASLGIQELRGKYRGKIYSDSSDSYRLARPQSRNFHHHK